MRALSERISALSPEKLELLVRSLDKNGRQAAETPVVSHQRKDGPLALSYAQERLWFLEQFQPGSPVYNVPAAIRLPGALDVRAMAWSFNEIVRRHEILRTTFVGRAGQPEQVIAPQLTLDLPVEDLQRYPAEEREAKAQDLAMAEARRVFDLGRGPPIRIGLVRLSPQDHLLLVTLHHIVADGWSLEILFRELSVLYEAACQGRPSPLARPSLQYADFAQWQRRWLTGERLAVEVQYWRERLAGAPEVLALPTDRPRPAVQSHAGAQHIFQCPRDVSERLVQIGRDSGASLFMVLLAAFNILLYRYTRETDLVVGTPIANRNRTELENLIGFFVNTLALRTDLSGDPAFLEVLRRVKEVTLGAYEHQDVPFEKLVEELQPVRHLGHHPLFQVLFALQNTPGQPPQALGDRDSSTPTGSREMSTGTAKFDLSVFFREATEGLVCGIEYSTDLFDAPTIEQMSRHFRALLAEIAAKPEQRLSSFSLQTQAERQLISNWNRTSVVLPDDGGVHRVFEMQAERTPDVLAVVSEDGGLTYRELNRRANQLAHFLRAHGVGPDVCVGCCMEPSPEMTVAVLGILKAGGAYVPLDPHFPGQRLALMVADARMPMVLTQERVAASLPATDARPVVLDTPLDAIERQSDANPSGHVDGDSLAYMIYTSGSTGRPKGVAMPHRPLLNLITWQNQRSTLGPAAKTLQFVSPSFDVSVQEIFATWCSGGTLVVVTDDVRRDPPLLLRRLADTAVERVFMAPVALRHLADAVTGSARVPKLKEVIVAGEQLQITDSIMNLFSRLDDGILCNQYGPAESHVVSEFIVPRASIIQERLPPIGRPIPNTQLYVLDPATLDLLPVGVPGELCIGGISLARGYFNRPDLTAEKFVPDPYGGTPGGRLYRTGDLARYRTDGNVEFIGRIDQQVKIRGFRIELGEVETVLGRHQSVKEAVVTASSDATDDKRLVAYVVASTGETPNVSELRRFLLDQLPGYMVPATFVFVGSLPLTATGKVDRRALPAPDRSRPDLEAGFASPRSPLEQTLATIWADVLGLERVGINDNFFELGGHSLLVTQLISRIRDRLDIQLPLKRVFEAPSVAEFAASMDRTARQPDPAKASDVSVKAKRGTDAAAVAAPTPEQGSSVVQFPVDMALERDNEARLLSQLDELSEDTVTSLLAKLLSETGVPADEAGPAPSPAAAAKTVKPPSKTLSAAPAAAPTPAGVDRHGPIRESYPPHAYGQHVLWQQHLLGLHLHLLQTMQELEGTLRQAAHAELHLLSFLHDPRALALPTLPEFADRRGAAAVEAQWLPENGPARGEEAGRPGPTQPQRRQAYVPQAAWQAAPKPKRFPTSFAQRRLWFLDQLQPGSTAYNVPSVLRLPGPLNLQALRWSLNEIVRRHDVLRTTFASEDGEPVQVIAPALTLDVPVEDLQRQPPDKQQAETSRLADEEGHHVFDLGRGPLIRARVLRLGAQDHILLINLHHVVADGWSLGILFWELSTLYEAACQGKPSPLSPLPIQYADFAQWQRRWLTDERIAEEVQYWRQRLAGAPAVLALPTDRPRPAMPSYAGAMHEFHCPRAIIEKLGQIALESGCTLFMVLLAAFKVLLYRLTGQEDLVVGTPIANRNRTELEGLIGFFINQLALRTDLSGDPSFLEVLRRVREGALGAYEHQDLPFEKLVEELQPARSLAQPPLFQVVFGLQNNPTQQQPQSAAAAPPEAGPPSPQIEWTTAKIDMNWQCAQTPDGLRGGIEYATDLFDAPTVEGMARKFESLLQQVADSPRARLSDFRLLAMSDAGGRTLRDFPELEMTQEDFENLIQEIRAT